MGTFFSRIRWNAIFRWVARGIAAFLLLSVVMVLGLRWINPVTSSFMVQRQWQAFWTGEEDFALSYEWTDWDEMAWEAKLAAVTSEDQRFAEHWGIDLEQVKKAIKESKRGEDLRGASTITQQTAKNLFLWPGRNYLRKGLEAYFAVLMELLWPKKRILEVYLNVAEFGDGVYGVRAAARRYFGTTPGRLTRSQSALMVTALPNPRSYNLASPSGYMYERQQWNLRYMNYLGNQAYLRRLD